MIKLQKVMTLIENEQIRTISLINIKGTMKNCCMEALVFYIIHHQCYVLNRNRNQRQSNDCNWWMTLNVHPTKLQINSITSAK